MQKVFPFSEYLSAVRSARIYAREMDHDVALRASKEFGRKVLIISLACRNDSDYDRAEIVRPSDPL